MIVWNGYPQPDATIEDVIEQAAGYCADHSADMSRCDCLPHVITVESDGISATFTLPRRRRAE